MKKTGSDRIKGRGISCWDMLNVRESKIRINIIKVKMVVFRVQAALPSLSELLFKQMKEAV